MFLPLESNKTTKMPVRRFNKLIKGSKDPVIFQAILKKSTDAYSVKKDLEGLAEGIRIEVHNFKDKKIQYVSGMTTQEVYEKIFGTKLSYEEKIVKNLSKSPRKFYEWTENEAVKVPKELADRVEEINLVKKSYLLEENV